MHRGFQGFSVLSYGPAFYLQHQDSVSAHFDRAAWNPLSSVQLEYGGFLNR